jgi:predicted naringenin-chalcone synthase
MPDAYIAGFGTALPRRITQERFLEVDAAARRLQGQSEETRLLVRQFALNSSIRYRHTVEPCWLPEDERPEGAEDIFTAHAYDPPGWLRARAWHRTAPALALRAARAALANWGGAPSDITHVVTTCTSGWSEPGIACELIYGLGLSLDCQKQELNFNGCFCGMTCLRLARDIVRAGEAGAVLVVAVEVASLQYDAVVDDMSTLVASVLFADGAGAFVVAPEGPWRFERAGMSLVPDTRPMLRMAPDTERPRDTYRMFLDRQVGTRLATFFREERGRELLDAVAADGRPALAVHPGGPNILEALKGVFVERGWPAGALEYSLATLYNTGNLGAAALLFVLARLLPDVQADRVASFAFGPGVTVEWGLLQRVREE